MIYSRKRKESSTKSWVDTESSVDKNVVCVTTNTIATWLKEQIFGY